MQVNGDCGRITFSHGLDPDQTSIALRQGQATPSTYSFAYLRIASGMTGVKKLARLPSASRNNSERFPHGWVMA